MIRDSPLLEVYHRQDKDVVKPGTNGVKISLKIKDCDNACSRGSQNAARACEIGRVTDPLAPLPAFVSPLRNATTEPDERASCPLQRLSQTAVRGFIFISFAPLTSARRYDRYYIIIRIT